MLRVPRPLPVCPGVPACTGRGSLLWSLPTPFSVPWVPLKALSAPFRSQHWLTGEGRSSLPARGPVTRLTTGCAGCGAPGPADVGSLGRSPMEFARPGWEFGVAAPEGCWCRSC